MREAYGGELPFKTPAPVSSEVAEKLAKDKPTADRDAYKLSGEESQAVKDINRRIIAGEELTEEEKAAAKEWLPGSSAFYDRLHGEGIYAPGGGAAGAPPEPVEILAGKAQPKIPVPDGLKEKGLFLSWKPGEPYVLPEGVKEIRKDVNNNPIAYELEGEIYYPPGSLPFEMGFRTETQRIQAGERPYGIYHGREVPEDSILEIDAQGYVVARHTQDELEKGNLDSIGRMGMLRFPVKDDIGRDVLLTDKQIGKLKQAENVTERFELAKEFNLIPNTMTLKEFTGEKYAEDLAKYNSDVFVAKQEQEKFTRENALLPDGNYIDKKELLKIHDDDPELYDVLMRKGYRGERGIQAAKIWTEDRNAEIAVKNAEIALLNARAEKQNKALKELKPFTADPGNFLVDADQKVRVTKPSVDVLGFIRATDKDKAEQVLIDAGYKLEDVREWQQTAKNPLYLSAIHQDNVREIRNDLYKTVKMGRGEDPAEYAARIDGLAQAKSLNTFSAPEKDAITKQRLIEAEKIGAGFAAVALPPVAGIAVIGGASAAEKAINWNYYTPQERAFSIGMDVATMLAFVYGPKVIGNLAKPLIKPLTTAGKAERYAVQAGKAAQKVENATQELSNFTVTTDLSKVNQVAMAERVQAVKAAEEVSRKADAKFISQFNKLKSVNTKTLKQFEKKAKIPGFKNAILDVRKAANEVETNWQYVDKAPFYTDINSPLKGQRLVDALAAQYNLPTKSTSRMPIWDRWVKEVNIQGKYKPESGKIELKNWGGTKEQNQTILHELSHPQMDKGLTPTTTKSLSEAAGIKPSRISYSKQKGLLTNPKDELARGVASGFEELSTIEYVRRISGADDEGYRRLILDRLEILGSKHNIKDLPNKIDRIAQGYVSKWNPVNRGEIPIIGNLTPAKLEANNRHILRLSELQASQRRLDAALNKAGSYLEPRYSARRQPYAGWEPAIREQETEVNRLRNAYNKAKSAYDDTGFQSRQEEMLAIKRDMEYAEQTLKNMESAKAKGDFPPDIGRETTGEIEKYLKGDNGKPSTPNPIREKLGRLSRESREKYEAEQRAARTALKEREVEIAKKAAEYRKPSPEPIEAKPNIKTTDLPKIQEQGISKPFGMPVKTKEEVKADRQQQDMDYGRMSPQQAARYREDTDQAIRVTSRNIEQELAKTKAFSQSTPAEWQQTKEAIRDGVEAQQKAIVQGATNAQAANSAKEAIQDALQSKPGEQVSPKTQPQTKQLEQLITKTVIKEGIKEIPPPKEPIRPPRIPGSILIPPGSQSSDEEKRKFLNEVEGFVTARRGSLKGKGDVWLVAYYPYGDKNKLVVVGAAPRGAQIYKGKGSMGKTAQLLKGIPPDKPVFFDTGAVDTQLKSVGGDKMVAVSVVDKSTRRGKDRASGLAGLKHTYQDGVIEVDGKGRGHIKLV